MTEVVFSAKKKGESRYEETISDRPATSGARVSTTGPRRKPQPADDLSHDRGGRAAARRSRPYHARSRVGVDEPGDGRRSTAPGRGAAPAASRAAGSPLGERSRVLRGGRAEGADPENASAQPGESRATAGQLRDVSASGPLRHAGCEELMRGVSTRTDGAVVKDFHQASGVEKSAVSDNFIASSREKLQELMERPLGELQLCAVLIDGTPFRDRQMMVALGINVDGRKTVLGLREGATENAAVVSELLGDLTARGLDFSVPRLYVLDGGKALAAAVRRHAGGGALIQRAQV